MSLLREDRLEKLDFDAWLIGSALSLAGINFGRRNGFDFIGLTLFMLRRKM